MTTSPSHPITMPPKEMGRGERILELLVDYEDDGLYSGSTWTGDLVKKLAQRPDNAAAVVRPIELETVGLIERDDRPSRQRYHWRPTARGREVDAILREITAARGGKFRGRVEAGISFSESSALR